MPDAILPATAQIPIVADRLHWAIAGFGIAAVALALQFVANRSLGLSSTLEDVCARFSRLPWFGSSDRKDHWRLWFSLGLIAGGAIATAQTRGWSPTWDAALLDSRLGLGPAAKLAWFFAGGLCVGIGTRMAGGCTSGHGIYGIARLQPASLAATVTFLGVGTVVSQVLFRVLFP